MHTFQCMICLEQKDEADKAFLGDCFHSFCLRCIKAWTWVQQRHPGADKSGEVRCPMCKTPYDIVISDYEDGNFQKLSAKNGFKSLPDTHEYSLTPGQRKRRRVYFQPERTPQGQRSRVSASWAKLVQRPEVRTWLMRELQALLLEEDVSIVTGVITSALPSTPQEESAWKDAINELSAKYLGDKASRFAQEMYSFISSGLSLSTYDRQLEAAEDAVSQSASSSLPGMKQAQEALHADSVETDSTSSFGVDMNSERDIQGSDSDDYEEIIMRRAQKNAESTGYRESANPETSTHDAHDL